MDVNRGTVLGLVGAERSLAAPSFLISAEFRSAAHAGLSGNLRVCALAIYLFVACIISSLAGPASGALMIPRVDWFFEKDLIYHNMPNNNYPHILIDSRLGQGEYDIVDGHMIFDADVVQSTLSGLDYWEQLYIQQTALGVVRVEDISHEFTDIAGRRYTNTSTTWGRPLNGDWSGGTTVSTTMAVGINHIRNVLSYEKSQNSHDHVRPCKFQEPRTVTTIDQILMTANSLKKRAAFTESSTYVADLADWSGRKYVTDGMGIQSHVQCRQSWKLPCTGTYSNSSHWCYLDTTGNNSALIRSSHNLLLMDGTATGASPKGVYMTEGPSLPNQYSKFRFSFEVLIDLGNDPKNGPNSNQPDAGNITICSISTMLRPMTISSLHIPFSPQFADYHQSTAENEFSRAGIYHENYLYYVHDCPPALTNNETTSTITTYLNFTYPPRNMSKPSNNPCFTRFAKIFLNSDSGSALFTQQNLRQGQVEAAALEIVVGGAFLQLIAYLNPTSSQYSVATRLILPESLMPEARDSFPDTTTYVLKVYNQGYGFRLSSRTGLLGMIVLIAHAIIAVFGSLWLVLWERMVISAWNTIPDYLALGIGSSITGQALENTCAGISGARTLGTVIVVGETTPEHLEITIVSGDTGNRPQSVLVRNRYGDKYGRRDENPREMQGLQ